MARQLPIVVDCDDTLVPAVRYFVDAYNRECGAAVDFEQQRKDKYARWEVEAAIDRLANQ